MNSTVPAQISFASQEQEQRTVDLQGQWTIVFWQLMPVLELMQIRWDRHGLHTNPELHDGGKYS